MAERRAAPTIGGLELVEHIGSGGFADVYLYEQKFPSRKVAVKVLHAAESDEALAQFYAEANVMAQLSGHPAIVAIHAADVSDDGRPHIVMEYCPPPALAAQYRTERISLTQALDTGIRIASAVETVHRAGMLHRDIKPNNILTSAYGAPKLTDFGIAGATGEMASYGMSVPWAPPEWFAESPTADPRGDVFSLAATVYSLLAGRSPFEVPGAANDNATLMNRIERQPLARLTRADVPDSLNQILARAMAKRPEDRPATALELARQLQDIQSELGQAQTRIEVFDASTTSTAPVEHDQRTFIRPVQIIVPDGPEPVGTLLRPRFISPVSEHTEIKAGLDSGDTTLARAASQPAPPPEPGAYVAADERTEESPDAPSAPRRRTPLVAAAALVTVLLALGGIALALGTGDDADPDPRSFAGQDDPPPVLAEFVPTPTDLKVKASARGKVRFTWAADEIQAGDKFGLEYEVGGAPQPFVTADETSWSTVVDAGSIVCGQVMLVRSDGQASAPSDRVCAQVGG
ncbi:serine/threonine-protein kinase [Nocardioides gilvus]|uniref:serine/threonine-protein kinase n=1 Tax=Nocardioides gilvus TaxID=1735589 RepID=UPI000D74E365|nr:serine/threonine-protein kinase [Nocardioides gilvus]